MIIIKVDNNILLKTPTVDDCAGIYELYDKDRDELVNIFSFVNKDSKLIDEQNFVRSLDSDKYLFNIFYNDQVCGKIGVYAYNEDERSYEIYYYIGSRFRKKGIAITSIKTFSDYVFDELNAKVIKFYINVDNVNSDKLARKLELKYIDTIKERDFCNGIYHDQKLYEMYK